MRPFELSVRNPSGRGALISSFADAWLPTITGALVFLFRLTSLNDLTNDHYMHLSWSQQILFGLLPGLDFVDPGMPLAWGTSAIVQALAPGPFSEAVFSSAMLGVTAALTCWVVMRLTQSRFASVMAAAVTAILGPRLYNYPKLLVPVLTLWLLQRYAEDRTSTRRIAIGVGLAAAILFRHDLGLYASVVALATVAITHRDSPHHALRALVMVGASTLLVLAPYLIYVQWSEGLVEHVRRGIEFSKGESHQLQYPWPAFPWLTPGSQSWSAEDAASFLYYFSWLLPLAAVAVALVVPGLPVPLTVASILFLALYLPIILRHPVDQRLPDVATPLAVVGALVATWSIRAGWRAGFRKGEMVPLRILGSVVAAVMLVVTFAATVNAGYVGGFARALDETRIERGVRGIVSKIRSTQQDGAMWPWAAFWPNSGDFPRAVLYLRACTSPDAYVLLTWASPEYFFFSQRRFASGHSMFLPPDAFTTPRDQAFMVSRLELERPPIALVDNTRGEQFHRAYPLVDDWIAAHYTPAATYRHYDGDEIAIAIRNDLRPTTSFGDEGWPCGLQSAPAQTRK